MHTTYAQPSALSAPLLGRTQKRRPRPRRSQINVLEAALAGAGAGAGAGEDSWEEALGTAEFLPLDLSDLRSVAAFSAEVERRHPRVHALLCNAAVWHPMEDGRRTADGYEMHFGVNHLGHVALAARMAEHMGRSPPTAGRGGDDAGGGHHDGGRIVFVSSGLLRSGRIDLEGREFVTEGRKADKDEDLDLDLDLDLDAPEGKRGNRLRRRRKPFAPTGYCDSKLMNALAARHLASLLPPPAHHVSAYAVCPGFCRTGLGRNVRIPWYKRVLLAPAMLLLQRPAARGAQNLVHAVVSPKGDLVSGTTYRDGRLAREEMDYLDSLGDDVARGLWELSVGELQEAMTGKGGGARRRKGGAKAGEEQSI